ncbi:MAG: thioredoxin family protein [Thermodesulfobacteriota bacterium]|jgi:small redox-active disulfide protein 2|nr:thioredoxin family protein [Thermodesulfobacteriota bacterium]
MKKVQILGTGCAKCNKLADNAKAAARSVGQEIELEKVSDLNEITKFGVLSTPGLAIDGKVVSQGKLLKPEQIAKLLAG